MDLYFLNFKKILVVINADNIRQTILKQVKDQEVDVNITFADSYSKAVKLIKENEFDQYDHISLSLSVSNRKLRDFLEFIQPGQDLNSKYIIQYTRDQKLSFLE
jgi:mannose/fructose/N-acetylgalactosamine-specific phosphotransferase system component IIB